MFSRTLLKTSKNYFFSMNPLSNFKHKPTINIENFDQDIDLVFWNFDFITRILVNQIVDFMGVDGSMVVQFLYQILHVRSDVVMKANICILLNFCILKLLSELLHSAYVFALFWWFNIFYDASCEICAIDLAVLLLKHKELKLKKVFNDLSPELYHLLARYSIGVFVKHTFDRLLNRFHKILDFWIETPWLQSDWLLDETVVITTNIL